MATLNMSTNGPSISRSYDSIVNSTAPSGSAAKAETYGQWAVFSVSTPLVNAFQRDAGEKDSVLKVQTTGEGDLADLIEEFSDGRVQFAFVKVRDPNTSLPKYVLIGWCGEGVPERTKGYFTSHLAAVSKVLHGYHVQITARSDRDLTPEGIVQKVSDASGSKYSAGSAPAPASRGPPPPAASKPVFTPTRVGGGAGNFNPLAGAKSRVGASRPSNTDEDGWGADAPPVTRSQLEKVESAYKPTKVNMNELTSQKQEPSRFSGSRSENSPDRSDVVRGGYQPIGKVDIAAIRRQAKESGSLADDRPSTVKGSYEPVGKVDIAAIRARSQRPSEDASTPPSSISPAVTGASARSGDRSDEPPKSLADRSSAFTSSERLTSLPKPKITNKFGSSTSTFTGTKAPTPGGFGLEPKPAAPAPVGLASRTFADEGGKTPAQIWAEKKARQRGLSGAGEDRPSASPITSQPSGGEWKSSYAGKSWAPVQISHTGKSATSSIGQQRTGQDVEQEQEEEAPASPAGGVSAIRDRFKGAPPMGGMALPRHSTGEEQRAPSPPPLDTASKPNAGVRGIPIPGLPSQSSDEHHVEAPRMPTPPPQPPRSPTPPTPPAMRSGSPIRVAMPVGRGNDAEVEAPEERFSPPPISTQSIADVAPTESELTDEPTSHEPARRAAEAAAVASFGHEATAAPSNAHAGGKRALIQYDYEKAEDNELELREGEYVTNIEMVDDDWWMGENEHGESGLFPSNYVELVEDDGEQPHAGGHEQEELIPPAGPAPGALGTTEASETKGAIATALYDYEAAESNELSFPEGGKITNVEFPDEDWWFGEHAGQTGLFPANYVQLDE
ncbi:MAG: hypothetical protein M1819_005010 [Sarea resinae]|nr:MAG: hypothetical protein M1819_005010 [Sarea resinae]